MFKCLNINEIDSVTTILGSIVVSISDCHSGDRGSIPRRGGLNFFPPFTFLAAEFTYFLKEKKFMSAFINMNTSLLSWRKKCLAHCFVASQVHYKKTQSRQRQLHETEHESNCPQMVQFASVVWHVILTFKLELKKKTCRG